jgi:hypothetical protein
VIFLIKKWLKNYIIDNKYEVLLFSTLFLIGVVVGIMTYIFAGDEVRRVSMEAVTGVLDLSSKEEFLKSNIIMDGLKSNIILIGILILMSITLFGRWGIYIIMMLKGISIGLYTAVIFNVFGIWWGIVVNLLLVVLVNVVYVPAIIYLCIVLNNLNFDAFRTRNDGLTSKQLFGVIGSILFSFILIFSSIILEQIFSTIVLNIYCKL